MNIRPVLNYKIKQVLTITSCWVLVGVVVELNNAVTYDPVSRGHYFHFVFGRNGFEHLLITAIGPLLGGLFAGSFIVFYQREKLKGKTYGRKLLVHSTLYLLFLVLCIGLVGVIGAINNQANAGFLQKLREDVLSLRVLRLFVNWYFIVIFTIFLLDVSDKYGPGTLRKVLLGKYHKPGKEDRVFMFLDLRSSTTIAEQIGEDAYFRMLRAFYHYANEAVINNYGEIYQYVGDEIVISWEKKTGLNNARCLQCYREINEIINSNSKYFQDEFGVIPGFKAGLHAGMVATGEIGLVKKDIVYSGDVLNTTARIVALCNQFGESLLISGAIYQEIANTPGYDFSHVDNILLRGKRAGVDIYAVRDSAGK